MTLRLPSRHTAALTTALCLTLSGAAHAQSASPAYTAPPPPWANNQQSDSKNQDGPDALPPATAPAASTTPTASASPNQPSFGIPSQTPAPQAQAEAAQSGDPFGQTVNAQASQNGTATPAFPTLDAPNSQLAAQDPNQPSQQKWNINQKAMDNPATHKGPGQTLPGYKQLFWQPGYTYTINARQNLETEIILPEGATITDKSVSDPNAWAIDVTPDSHAVKLTPTTIGVDANLLITDDSGKTYSFYLRSHPWNYEYVADIIVNIGNYPAGISASRNGISASSSQATLPGMDPDIARDANSNRWDRTENTAYNSHQYDDDPSARLTERPRALSTKPGEDYAAVASTGAGRIRTDLTIKVGKKEDAIVAPVSAWRDDHFVYLDFGPRATAMSQWPVPSLVVDSVESPVQHTVAGPNRSIMVIKALGPVVLRSGDHIVCIGLELNNDDPRAPRYDQPYADQQSNTRPPVDIEKHQPAPIGLTGSGKADYQLDLAGSGESSSASKKMSIKTGPYTPENAQKLTEMLSSGYHGLPSIAATTTPDADGVHQSVIISPESLSQTKAICQMLTTYNHPCHRF